MLISRFLKSNFITWYFDMCHLISSDKFFYLCLKFPDLINEKQFFWNLIHNEIDGTHYLLSYFIIISFFLPLFLSFSLNMFCVFSYINFMFVSKPKEILLFPDFHRGTSCWKGDNERNRNKLLSTSSPSFTSTTYKCSNTRRVVCQLENWQNPRWSTRSWWIFPLHRIWWHWRKWPGVILLFF